MKKYLGISILLILICGSSVFAQQTNFITPEQAVEEIKKYYKEREDQLHVTINLLDIINSQENSNIMFVFFLKDQDPDVVKDLDGNITNSKKVPVLLAVYTYSHLKHTWRLFEIKPADSGLVFEVD
jgi:hypothetical protein